MGTRSFHLMNEPLTILLPKIAEAATIKDFWPIFLIHSLGKLFSKVLENKLAPWLQEMVHHSQNTFIKGHFIQDNFKFVQSSARLLHAKKKPCLPLKVDITRAFDSVVWPLILDRHHAAYGLPFDMEEFDLARSFSLPQVHGSYSMDL
jgi:hypothetical protein